jgi:hypothetical protein
MELIWKIDETELRLESVTTPIHLPKKGLREEVAYHRMKLHEDLELRS